MPEGVFAVGRACRQAGADNGAKLTERIVDSDVKEIIDITSKLSPKNWLRWLNNHKDEYPSMVVLPLSTFTPEAMRYRMEGKRPKVLFFTRPLHTLYKLNECLYTANELMDNGAYLCCHSMTAVIPLSVSVS